MSSATSDMQSGVFVGSEINEGDGNTTIIRLIGEQLTTQSQVMGFLAQLDAFRSKLNALEIMIFNLRQQLARMDKNDLDMDELFGRLSACLQLMGEYSQISMEMSGMSFSQHDDYLPYVTSFLQGQGLLHKNVRDFLMLDSSKSNSLKKEEEESGVIRALPSTDDINHFIYQRHVEGSEPDVFQNFSSLCTAIHMYWSIYKTIFFDSFGQQLGYFVVATLSSGGTYSTGDFLVSGVNQQIEAQIDLAIMEELIKLNHQIPTTNIPLVSFCRSSASRTQLLMMVQANV